jgi:hypothetical protein
MIRRIILTAVTTIALAAPALAQTNTMSPAKPAVVKTDAKPATAVKTTKPTVRKVSHKTTAKPATVKKTTA